ncbi:L,D-transpeptidase [Methylocystis echinoides]|uniref:L,D-transpeptidase family protein n=1 Tax=Methylocystis echinoides TaxID=29468 RepID=UPI00343E56E3
MADRSAFFRRAAPAAFLVLLLGAAYADPAGANPALTAAPPYPEAYYPQQSALGGGLIEALVGAGAPRVRSAAPPPGAHVAAYAPAAPLQQPQRALDPSYARTDVAYDGPEAPGTIVVDTPSKFLYFINGRGRATRYGVGVGRPGFEWSGVKTVSRKAEWPDWTPPAEMLARRPDLPRHMDGGPANPLGARALYLGSSLYRIHGTNEPGTIGQNVSSGCIRMMNEDVIDLYDRAPVGTRVVVR